MMRKKIVCFLGLFMGFQVAALQLQDYPIYDYDLRFTNPLCDNFRYTEDVFNRYGQRLDFKPKNVWCGRGDSELSASQLHSPQRKIIEWIRDPQTTEIFFAFLSFSNSVVYEELCAAVEERSVKIRFVIDDSGNENRLRYARQLEECEPASGLDEDRPELFLRGHHSGLGYAHNKMILINPRSEEEVKISFGSANLSSGTHLHHENWHFVRTIPQSHFAQIHFCLEENLLTSATEGRRQFMAAVRECREAIEYEEESDIQVFLAPGEHTVAEEVIHRYLENSREVLLAAHRLSWRSFIEKLVEEMGREENPLQLKTLVDDDIYWIGQIQENVGPNSGYDYGKLMELIEAGAQNKYMETNHNEFMLHHNKFLIFQHELPGIVEDAVFTGAGNFTGAAFSKNLENYYLIKIPEVVEGFKNQYRHMWNELATEFMAMPLENVRATRVRE